MMNCQKKTTHLTDSNSVTCKTSVCSEKEKFFLLTCTVCPEKFLLPRFTHEHIFLKYEEAPPEAILVVEVHADCPACQFLNPATFSTAVEQSNVCRFSTFI